MVCSCYFRKPSTNCSEHFSKAPICFVIPKFNFVARNQLLKYYELNMSNIKMQFLLTIDYLSTDNLVC